MKLREGSKKTETAVFNSILALVKRLETADEGTILTTSANIQLLREVKSRVNRIVLNKTYKSRVNTFLNQFNQIKSSNDKYFKGVSGAFNPNRNVYKEIVRESIVATSNSLTEAGLEAAVVEPIKNNLQTAITSRQSFADLTDNLRFIIKGNEERLGSLERHITQIATDSMNQFTANYTTAVSGDLGLEFWFYSGSVVEDSRSYCVERAGKYFHTKEVEQSANEQWAGKIAGTNEGNIFINRGGWNCAHLYLPTSIEGVPRDVINRAISKGFIEPIE